jgi:hypothetical protein
VNNSAALRTDRYTQNRLSEPEPVIEQTGTGSSITGRLVSHDDAVPV